ncbi:zinc-binding dehydrogenase [Gordonia jinghuaiqii]|uniref:Zinc-binding dehydrogenase n=1 Tax=Gordonia jinghuaiqii TaxID=2758710 RepID=A0A7D7QZ41_9ACTN|nr:zinc-binding dehydrogenase [Gordonia jinghuaiqii]MCR5978407.1 zinc-binding dehydrogenase [Gordonia jinghuaiqii]QMT02748.1 zinc-binding dehydrogenase [Gordonia jinghuaiqii]
MLSVYAVGASPTDPMSALEIGERPEPARREGWTTVEVKAASLNHHDIWALKGIGLPASRLPMILGSDGAGLDESGRRVIIHPVIDDGSTRSVLSERFNGTFASFVSVPTGNLIELPNTISFEEAACLPTAWLTAYRMLFERAKIGSDDLVLVQGASGGLSTALIMLAKASGARVWVTGTSAEARRFAADIGAEATFEVNARLPQHVDVVMDSVGAATWNHSLKCLRAGGTMVVPGATTGYEATINIALVFAKQLTIVGSSMGSLEQLADLTEFCSVNQIRPPVAATYSLGKADRGFLDMIDGRIRGKVVFTASS